MIRWLKEMLLLNILLVPPMIFFPALCLLPPLLVWRSPGEDWSSLAQLLFWFGPFSAAFWVLLYSQWSGARKWQKMGKLHQWRRDHGGFLVTIPKACCWMVFGLVGSFIAELVFLWASYAVPRSVAVGAASRAVWFALLPCATYSPLLFTWAWRRRHA